MEFRKRITLIAAALCLALMLSACDADQMQTASQGGSATVEEVTEELESTVTDKPQEEASSKSGSSSESRDEKAQSGESGSSTAEQAAPEPSASASSVQGSANTEPASEPAPEPESVPAPASEPEPEPAPASEPAPEPAVEQGPAPAPEPEPEVVPAAEDSAPAPSALPALSFAEEYRVSFVHGDKGAEFQKYIVLHDTEGTGDAYSVIDYWDGAGTGVAAHFIVNMDGSVVQCVPLDKITHHAGFGDTGHNALYGVEDESRDDKVGTTPIGDWAADYGMNSYSVGIEMVHVGGSGYYPEEQLAAVDAVIAYIDAYYGFPSAIIDHKAWRSGNSDTSPEFAGYLANYQDHRTHY